MLQQASKGIFLLHKALSKYSSFVPLVLTMLFEKCCTQTGWTPLMKASRKGHADIVRVLVKAKAQINIQEEVWCSYHIKLNTWLFHFCLQHGRTALYLATDEGKVDVVRLLIKAKAHVNIQTEVHTSFLNTPIQFNKHIICHMHILHVDGNICNKSNYNSTYIGLGVKYRRLYSSMYRIAWWSRC